METTALTVAIVTMVAALLTLFGVRLRRRKLWLSAHVNSLSESPEGRRREEVSIELITGPEPLLIEVVSLSPVGKRKSGWALGMTPGPSVDEWPEPIPSSGLLRLDACSTVTYRLGWLTTPARFIDDRGEITVRPYALLARPSLSAGWTHHLGGHFLKFVKRMARRYGAPIKVQAWPSDDTTTHGQISRRGDKPGPG